MLFTSESWWTVWRVTLTFYCSVLSGDVDMSHWLCCKKVKARTKNIWGTKSKASDIVNIWHYLHSFAARCQMSGMSVDWTGCSWWQVALPVHQPQAIRRQERSRRIGLISSPPFPEYWIKSVNIRSSSDGGWVNAGRQGSLGQVRVGSRRGHMLSTARPPAIVLMMQMWGGLAKCQGEVCVYVCVAMVVDFYFLFVHVCLFVI